jgi:ABC-type bacteriocin/lantibiotic exporter with double-glycine peptidase domain
VKAVIQEEISGCGIAAVAALAGVSYGQAKRRANSLGIYARDRSLWSDTDYVRRLLKTYGLHAPSGEPPFRDWATLPDRALLAIKWHRENGRPFWHWVVFVREGDDAYVLDSKKALKQHCRRDFGRIKPKWFIPVSSG